MNQFFYTRKNPLQPKVGETELQFEYMTDSFNVECVLRSYEYEKGKLYVLLNDGHEESREQPTYSNTGKEKGVERKRQWVVSEIYLEGEDVDRFRQYFNCDKFNLYAKSLPAENLAEQLNIPFVSE